jgi:peroxiredoxin 2/4
VFSHIKGVEWINGNLKVEIPFPIIADDMRSVAMQFGMVHPGKATNIVLAVFLIDPEGKVRLMLYYPQEIGRQIDEVLRALKALQISDANKVAIPENWPNNNITGDKVIYLPQKIWH